MDCHTGALQQYGKKKCLIDEIVLTNKIERCTQQPEIGEAHSTRWQSLCKGNVIGLSGLVNKYNKLTKSESVSLASCEDIRNIYDELGTGKKLLQRILKTPLMGKSFGRIRLPFAAQQKVIHTG